MKNIFLFCIFLSLGCWAHGHREFGPHVHGVANLSIAIDKNIIEAELDIPGVNLIGFEHQPKTLNEKKQFKLITSKMKKNYELFDLPQNAQCKVIFRNLIAEQHKGENHMDYSYTTKYKCLGISKVGMVNVNLFKDYKTLNKIRVQIITDAGESSAELTSHNNELKIK